MEAQEGAGGDLVLVVEDSRAFARMLKARIEEEGGMRAVLAMSFAECREVLDTRKIAAAVLDLNLPDAPDGQVVDYVVARGIPAIVLTGDYSQAIRKRILRKNVVDYFIKDSSAVLGFLTAALRRLFANRGVKILLVDDSPAFRAYANALLSRHNFTVLEAGSAAEAKAAVEANADLALAIVDYSLPDASGDGLVRDLRKLRERDVMAIIGVSGSGDPHLTAMFLKSGASDFLHKPFSDEEFHLRVVQNVGLIEQLARLRELNEVKNRFIGMAAHDLRNPISSISGFGQILAEGLAGPLTPLQTRYLNNILDASRHMLGMVNDILDVSIIERGKASLRPEETDLTGLVARRVEMHGQTAAGKNIAIGLELAEGVTAWCDRGMAVQLVDNLVSNAVKYSPPGSEVTVRLESGAGEACLEVRDQGPGISEADRGRLFGAFQRLSAKPTAGEKSVGLGLAIVKRIVEAHGGRIGVRNAPEGGAVFRVCLPLRQGRN